MPAPRDDDEIGCKSVNRDFSALSQPASPPLCQHDDDDDDLYTYNIASRLHKVSMFFAIIIYHHTLTATDTVEDLIFINSTKIPNVENLLIKR